MAAQTQRPTRTIGSILSQASSRDYRTSIAVQNRPRSFRVHLPPETVGPLPLLIALHGTGIDGDRMAAFCGLSQCADSHGFAVVYPDGTGRTADALSWNIGHRSSYAAREKVDDIQFIRALSIGSVSTLLSTNLECI